MAGLIVGVPAIAIGSRLDPTQSVNRPFWPSRQSTIRFCWDILLVATFVSVPTILLPTFWLVPAGDSWLLAIARISLLTFFLAATFGWMKNCGVLLEKWYRGRASEKLINYFANPGTSDQKTPASLWTTFWECCSILAIATIAFSVVFGFVDFNDRWLQLDLKGPKRFRGLAKLLMWCRGNPNSTWSTSLWIGLGALGLFAHQIIDQRRGLRRKKSDLPGPEATLQ